MLKLKKGMRVRCKHYNNIIEGNIDIVGYDYKIEGLSFRKRTDGTFTDSITDLENIDNRLEYVQEGDEICNGMNDFNVLGVCGKMVFVCTDSNSKDFFTWTIDELKNVGYKRVVPNKPIQEVTMKEVCDKFGYEVKIKKGEGE